MKYLYLWFICLFFAGVFLYAEYRKKHIAAVILKGLASLCFVTLGMLGAKLSGNGPAVKNITAGLILGMIADVMLNLRFAFPQIGKMIFLAGILVFLAGHVMYIIALAPMCDRLPLCAAAAVVLTALLLKWIFTRITAAKAFRIFGVFYLGAIMLMTCISWGLLFTAPSVFTRIFAAGAVMFLASDIILILNTFGSKQKESFRIANIVLYYIGQLLIASALQFM